MLDDLRKGLSGWLVQKRGLFMQGAWVFVLIWMTTAIIILIQGLMGW